MTIGHEQITNYQKGYKRQRQHEAAMASTHVLDREFTAYGEMLERVEVFKYLGQLLAFNNNGIQAMCSNLNRIQGKHM